MAMTGAMGAGLAGMRVHMDALNVVGNNVANVNTYGYKAGRVTFRDSIYSTLSAGSGGTDTVGGTNPSQIGYGVNVGTIDLDMSSQSVESTGRDLDTAIVGDGFLLVGDKSGVDVDSLDSLTLTRVGDLRFDQDGYLVDGDGNVVYGFVPANTEKDGDFDTDAGPNGTNISTNLVPIRLPMAAKGENGWENDPNKIQPGDALYPGVNGDGLNDYDFGTDSTGECIKYENLSIDANGKITCTNKDTKEPVVVGYIALGSVPNPNGLTHTQGPYFKAGSSSGSITISTPGSAITGYLNNQEENDDPDPSTMLAAGSGTTLMNGFLETSGTDLATEFANMIIYQRGYQANTRIVSVTDSMLEELVNMKR